MQPGFWGVSTDGEDQWELRWVERELDMYVKTCLGRVPEHFYAGVLFQELGLGEAGVGGGAGCVGDDEEF